MRLPDCPSCSILTTNHREAPLLWKLPRTGLITIMACCPLSRGAPALADNPENQGKLNQWWRLQRLKHHDEHKRKALDDEESARVI